MATNAEEFRSFQAHIVETVDSYRQGKGISRNNSEYMQVGSEVVDFSSQYGSESSILSYVAANIAGQPSVFPAYGDYTQACVFRTYGPWWYIAPSGVAKYGGTPSNFTSSDYIEVLFPKCIYPEKIEIYETYNPGSIVRILACDIAGGTDTDEGRVQWVTLWAGESEPHIQKPNIFCPPLRKISFTTNLIRIELNHDFLDYYTELDGIRMYGRGSIPQESCDQHSTSFTDAIDSVCHHTDGKCNAGEDQLLASLKDFVLTDCEDEDEENMDGLKDSFFSILPKEIIHLISTYLNTMDICRLAQTCRSLRDHCYDPMLYTELNLKPYWTQVLNSTFPRISSRCSRLQRLNLSWCGKGGPIYTKVLEEFFAAHNRTLQSIEFSSCPFMTSDVLTIVAVNCTNLTELNLASCTKIDDFSLFASIPLKNLTRLNLYRTKIDAASIVFIFRSNSHLKHLNISSCQLLNHSIELVLMELGSNCKELRSLDMWRLKAVNNIGLSHLYNGCSLLEELDVGWCVGLLSESKCFINLAQKCRKLKKLFLTANRTIHNRDMKAIADFCPDMEQLDILGTREVSKSAINYLLETCKNMKLLDVSFCLGIDFANVWAWRAAYPHVNIKKSFQNIAAAH